MHAELEVVGEQKSYGNFFIKEYGEIFSHIFNLISKDKIDTSFFSYERLYYRL